eukprot:6135541-Pyramimonas_sp.AAC.1
MSYILHPPPFVVEHLGAHKELLITLQSMVNQIDSTSSGELEQDILDLSLLASDVVAQAEA